MILDTGICTIYSISNTAAPGNKPVYTPVLRGQSWYKELNFETSPRVEDLQERVEISARIRILQNRIITNHDVVILSTGSTQYEVTRAFHGVDEESGDQITDLTLAKVVNAYDLNGPAG